VACIGAHAAAVLDRLGFWAVAGAADMRFAGEKLCVQQNRRSHAMLMLNFGSLFVLVGVQSFS
jgi:hypothetical protein